MPSNKDYLDFVLNQISELKNVSWRAMMGEYVIYYQQKVIGGIYDDRFLLKPTRTALEILNEAGLTPGMDFPYPGAKEMIVADIDDQALTCRMIAAIANDLPAKKQNNHLGRARTEDALRRSMNAAKRAGV